MTWARFRGRNGDGGWYAGLPRSDPHFAWWVTDRLRLAFERGVALELEHKA